MIDILKRFESTANKKIDTQAALFNNERWITYLKKI
jgi:hypothetical protein